MDSALGVVCLLFALGIFGLWVFFEMVRSLMRPPVAGAGWTWGAFWWGPLYYVIHDLTPKGWSLMAAALVLGAVTFGLIAPFFWIYCAIDAGGYAAKLAVMHEMQAERFELNRQQREADRARREREQRPAPAAAPSGGADAGVGPGAGSFENRLAALKSLRDKGVITEAEYTAKRKALIDQL